MRSNHQARHIGLARALSKFGYCSRSRAAEIIRAGSVRLNGTVRRDPETPVQLHHDRIEVGGRLIKAGEAVYLMMNKPRGLITTASDEKGRQTVYSLLAAENLPWVAPVGRLDKASEGLLLLTNDSEWGARIAAPETHLRKTYHVQIGSVEGERVAEMLVQGIRLSEGVNENGTLMRTVSASVLRVGEKNCWLEIVLDEGRNRQIRRMLAALDIEVLRLVRVAIGPLHLGQLAKGSFRPLNEEEKQSIDNAINPAPNQRKSSIERERAQRMKAKKEDVPKGVRTHG